MAFDREAAKAAGYSDEEIDAFIKSTPAARRKVAEEPPAPESSLEPPPPTTVIPETGTTEGALKEAATVGGIGLAPYAVPAAGAVAAAAGGSKLYGAWKESARAAQAMADAKLASEQGIAQRAAQRAAGVRPVAPQVSPILDAAGRPMAPSAPVQPVAPQGMAPQAQAARAPSVLQSAQNIVQKLALDKLLKAGAAGALALTPGNVGQNYNVPSVGRMKGTEINPLTRQPWTPEQVKQYEANYQMFDQQLPPPQMPR